MITTDERGEKNTAETNESQTPILSEPKKRNVKKDREGNDCLQHVRIITANKKVSSEEGEKGNICRRKSHI